MAFCRQNERALELSRIPAPHYPLPSFYCLLTFLSPVFPFLEPFREVYKLGYTKKEI